MKTFYKSFVALGFILLIPCCSTFAQVGINTDNSLPDPSAMLDVKSDIKGLLVPRMTTAKRITIASPAEGLMVYDTDLGAFCYYHSGSWILSLSSSSGWQLNGNSGTNPSTNFIGTTDNKDLIFRVNNMASGRIEASLGNTSLGYQTLISIVETGPSEGMNNTAIGEESLMHNTWGQNNTAVGIVSLYNNTEGAFNTAVGDYALFSNTTGEGNEAIGDESLYSNTIGSNNIAIGESPLHENTEGSNNTACGVQSIYFNTTGSDNTAYGEFTLTHNTTGSSNIAIGWDALFLNSTGNSNIAIGSEALRGNASGHSNIAIGPGALQWAIGLSNNVAVGDSALYLDRTGGIHNTAMGSKTLFNNFFGNNNTANGYQALYNSQGNNNTAIGSSALLANNDGSGNTCIGANADVVSSSLDNAMALGYQAVVNASNKVRIGNSSVSVIEGQVAWSYPSDGRFKKNISRNVPGLAFITQLDPVLYDFENSSYASYVGEKRENSDVGKDNVSLTQMGFVAQDVEKVCREQNVPLANFVNVPSTEKEAYSMSYSTLVVPLVKAVQEQQAIIEKQQKQIEQLVKRIDVLENK